MKAIYIGIGKGNRTLNGASQRCPIVAMKLTNKLNKTLSGDKK